MRDILFIVYIYVSMCDGNMLRRRNISPVQEIRDMTEGFAGQVESGPNLT